LPGESSEGQCLLHADLDVVRYLMEFALLGARTGKWDDLFCDVEEQAFRHDLVLFVLDTWSCGLKRLRIFALALFLSHGLKNPGRASNVDCHTGIDKCKCP